MKIIKRHRKLSDLFTGEISLKLSANFAAAFTAEISLIRNQLLLPFPSLLLSNGSASRNIQLRRNGKKNEKRKETVARLKETGSFFFSGMRPLACPRAGQPVINESGRGRQPLTALAAGRDHPRLVPSGAP